MKNKYQKYEKYSKEDLVEEIIKLKKRKKYGLVWEEKPEDVVEQCKKELPILEETRNKEILTDSNKPINLLIEGDNYHALSVLNYTHKGKIDVIYIDPPYNTGAKNWKYNNDYVDKEDAYRHSKWISLMNRRLKLAKKLLKSDGALICAIDENEHGHLDVLLEGIFKNFERHSIAIIHNPKGVQGKNFSYTHEYAVFVIPKNKKTIIQRQLADNEIYISNLRNWGGESRRSDAKNCFYPIIVKNGQIIGFGDVASDDYHPKASNEVRKDGSIFVWPIDNEGVERKWRYAKQSVEEIIDVLRIKKTRNEIQIVIAKDYGTYKTTWIDKRYDASEYGTKLLKQILPNCSFEYPKSLWTVFDCIYAIIGKKKTGIVLDFFAGSGTTAHAVLEMNTLDNGKRQFILNTNNENNICTKVTYPRISTIIHGYNFKGTEKTTIYENDITIKTITKLEKVISDFKLKKQENKDKYDKFEIKIEDNNIRLYGIKKIHGKKTGLGGNLKYYKTSFVPADSTDKNKATLTQKATEMLCVKEGTFEKVKSNKQYKIFCNKNRYTGIIFDHLVITDFKKVISKINGKFSIYVFSLGDDTFDEEFADMKRKVKLSPIPEAILRVYRRIYK